MTVRTWTETTYLTPLDDGLSGQAKNLIAGRYRDRPAFHDIIALVTTNAPTTIQLETECVNNQGMKDRGQQQRR